MTPTFITRPLCGSEVRMFFTARGKLRFILSDVLAALEPNHRTKSALRDIRADHIRPLSRKDATETVDQLGLNTLALNTRNGGGLRFVDFLRTLPRSSPEMQPGSTPTTSSSKAPE